MIQILWGSESEGVREKKMNMYMYICICLLYSICTYNGPNNEGLIPIRLLSYRFGLAGLEYLNHKCVCFLS